MEWILRVLKTESGGSAACQLGEVSVDPVVYLVESFRENVVLLLLNLFDEVDYGHPLFLKLIHTYRKLLISRDLLAILQFSQLVDGPYAFQLRSHQLN